MSTLPQTNPIFSCPQCHTPVRASDAVCHACGINLALAAVLAERYTRATLPGDEPGGARPTAELPRFGEYLVGQGYITPAQLQAGLSQQRESAARGAHKTIGQTLLGLGTITAQQLELASIDQVKRLQSALEETNRRLEQRVAERTQALQTAVQRLTELDELKANFIANISHELRTPLVPMKGFADLLLNGSLGVLSDGQFEAVETISRSAQRLETLINQLIQFASSVKGKLTINLTIVYLPDLVEPLWDYFQPRADSAGVSLHRQLPNGLPLAMADAEKVYWVLYQLLDNGIKFTPAGGAVTLAAEARPARLRISVADTGMGISAEQLGMIFEPFSQGGDNGSGQLVDGTGLGLALVKRIVGAHNSQVEVVSAPGQGSTFAFDLALARPAAAP
ncbi:MAG: HAMP domain-containing sensor histidine kinase [Anaerolineales bacterium]